jgi:uncharacterized protein DUF4136
MPTVIRAIGCVAIAVLVLTHEAVSARVDVRVEYDKTFDFKPVRTYGWNSRGRGEVMVARTEHDDPQVYRQRAEPIIVDAVTTEMKQVGLQPAGANPDLFVTYYLLLTIGESAQQLGQFLPATTAWGLPPFAPATQSLEMVNGGSLVLDLSTKDTIVWRGVARAKLKMDVDDRKREAVIRESVRDLLRKYPRR